MLPLSYGLEVIHFLEHPRTKRTRLQTLTPSTNVGSGGRLEAPAGSSPAPRHKPIEMVFSNISLALAGGKAVLRDVSGSCAPGEVLAIMGPSGSGKTTLLNILGGRLKATRGNVLLNGEPLNKQLRRRICYVLQNDVFFPDLTLRQTLEYSALLRLPESMSRRDKLAYVDHIINLLDLRKCQNTIIGDNLKRGLSGGERKRANIACELLMNPTLLLLDEPTTGLDSSTAFSMMAALKEYAVKERKAIIVTVHQPSSQIFHLFDKLLLLCNGQVAYFGAAPKVVDFLGNIGFQLAPHYNPADFIMEQIKSSAENQEKIITAFKIIRKLSEPDISRLPDVWPAPWEKPAADIRTYVDTGKKTIYTKIARHVAETNDDDSGRSSWSDSGSSVYSSQGELESGSSGNPEGKWATAFTTQLGVLARRNFQEARKRVLCRLNWLQTIGLGLVAGLLWFQLERTEERVKDIRGWMFFSSTYWMLFTMFGALVSFPTEREVINKERAAGMYRLSAYYLAKMAGELPLTVTLPSVFHFISYPLMGCQGPATFLGLWSFQLLCSLVAESIGLFVGAACMDFQLSVTIAALYSTSTMLLGGFYTTAIPSWLSWARYLSIINYAFSNMQHVEFGMGSPIRCALSNSKFLSCRRNHTATIPYEELMASGDQGTLPLPFWANTAILVGYLVVFRLLGYLVLRYFRRPN